MPRGSDLFQKIVGLLEPEYGSEWKTGHWFKIEARSSCDYTEQVFKHEIILSFDEDWKVALSNLRAASRVEVGRQAEVKERVIGNTTTREQKNAVVKKGTSDAAAQKNGKKMKGEHDREWEMVVKEGGDEDWELI